MSAKPWLTAADRAEFDVYWRVLVDWAFEHRESCRRCVDDDCPVMRRKIEAVVEWAELRSALSFAIGMRQRQNLIDSKEVA